MIDEMVVGSPARSGESRVMASVTTSWSAFSIQICGGLQPAMSKEEVWGGGGERRLEKAA
jgi:hypothetical protein